MKIIKGYKDESLLNRFAPGIYRYLIKTGEGSLRVIAKRFSVSLSFVWSLWARYKQTGSVEPKPHGGGRAVTIITVLSLHEVIVALLIPHTVDGDVFKGFIKKILVPVLQPGDRVLMDNLNAH